MKNLLLLSILIAAPASAITWDEFWRPFKYRTYHTYQTPICTKTIRHKEFVRRSPWDSGYYRYWTETIRVPCSAI